MGGWWVEVVCGERMEEGGKGVERGVEGERMWGTDHQKFLSSEKASEQKLPV